MFRLKIALFATLISGSVLMVFGLFFLFVINKVSLDRIDREILALGESQLHIWHPKSYWQNFSDSIRFIYGPDRWKNLIVQVKDADDQVLYQSPQWPAALSAESFAEFDFTMEDGPPPNRPPPDHPPVPPFGIDGRLGQPPPQRPPRRTLNNDDIPPPPPQMKIKKPVFQTVKTESVTWRTGIMGNPHLTIIIGMDMAGFYLDVDRFQKAFLFTVPVALLLMAAGGWVIAHRAIKPVALITQTAEGITARGLDRRIPFKGADSELQRLVNVINAMLDRLSKSFEQALRFSADAAHELQTPLTILQGVLDDGIRHAPSGSDEQRRYSDLLEEVRRLKVIVQKLLILARADAGQLSLQLEPVNISLMTDSIIEDASAIAPHLRIEQEIAANVMIQADKTLLYQMLQNLSTNAIKYNTDKGLVRFELCRLNHQVIFRISNTGPMIPAQDRERIFDRFFRMDKSRSHKVPGTGLGLSLAREIAHAHNGELTLDITPDRLLTFTLSLPGPP